MGHRTLTKRRSLRDVLCSAPARGRPRSPQFGTYWSFAESRRRVFPRKFGARNTQGNDQRHELEPTLRSPPGCYALLLILITVV